MNGRRRQATDRPGLDPPARLGVIGGGQLGRMFLQVAQRMGYTTVVLSESEESPAAQVAHDVVVGASNDPAALRRLADATDAVTVEFENVFAPGLRWLERTLVVRPGWRTVWVSQNRLREKRFLGGLKLPLAPWRPVREEAECRLAVEELGLPLILKTAASGYDGKGQIRVRPGEDALAAWSSLGRVACVAEQVVDFIAEVSVVTVRGHDGQEVAYPVCWNTHTNHILDVTICPAPIGPIVALEAKDLAIAVARGLGTIGVLTVEFFLRADGGLLINEIAPRPHNSGHLTIEAASSSQFEQQVRALAGLPLGEETLHSPAAMVNLLGELWSGGEPNWRSALAADPAVKLHLYGKHSASTGRKMGHITVLDRDSSRAAARARAARRALTDRSPPG